MHEGLLFNIRQKHEGVLREIRKKRKAGRKQEKRKENKREGGKEGGVDAQRVGTEEDRAVPGPVHPDTCFLCHSSARVFFAEGQAAVGIFPRHPF